MSANETSRVHAGSHRGGHSSYDAVPQEDIITPDQFKESMRFVRLQIAIPISGTSLYFAIPSSAPFHLLVEHGERRGDMLRAI